MNHSWKYKLLFLLILKWKTVKLTNCAYQNVEKELTNEPLKISKGNNINNLNGTLLRNGPGILERGGQWVHHPFDGDGMITSIKFENGQPFLTNRFVKTKGYLEEEKNK